MKNKGTANICAAVLACIFILAGCGNGNQAVSYTHLHFAEPAGSQRGTEHYPKTLVMENTIRQRQELLNESLPGGMMGGYIEENFPFYFVNRRMLNYLGYADEAEFVADIEGCVSNCMHPEDRDMVERAVMEQLAEDVEYVCLLYTSGFRQSGEGRSIMPQRGAFLGNRKAPV